MWGDSVIKGTIIHKINRSSNNLIKHHFISFVKLLGFLYFLLVQVSLILGNKHTCTVASYGQYITYLYKLHLHSLFIMLHTSTNCLAIDL